MYMNMQNLESHNLCQPPYLIHTIQPMDCWKPKFDTQSTMKFERVMPSKIIKLERHRLRSYRCAELDWSFGHPRPHWDHSISHLNNDKNGPQEGSRDKFTWHHVQTVLTKIIWSLIQLNATTLSLEITETCSCCRLTIKVFSTRK